MKAIGYSNYTIATDSMTVDYTTNEFRDPWNVKISQRNLNNGNILIEAVMNDYNGNRCFDYNGQVFFSKLSGQGELLVNYGTITRSSIVEMANGYAAVEFKPVSGSKAVIGVMPKGSKGEYYVIKE